MALEFIVGVDIEHGKKIEIPRGADCYRLKSGKINFFNSNPNPTPRMKLIPYGAAYISFDIEGNAFTIEYGLPHFYSEQGNDLNMENNC